MEKPISPCMNCPSRKQGCHSRCLAYKDYATKQEEYRKFVYDSKYRSFLNCKKANYVIGRRSEK